MGKPKSRLTYRCHGCSWIGRRYPEAAAKPCPKCKGELYVATGPAKGRTTMRLTIHVPLVDLQALGEPKSWRPLIRLAVSSLAASRRSSASTEGAPDSGLTVRATAV